MASDVTLAIRNNEGLITKVVRSDEPAHHALIERIEELERERDAARAALSEAECRRATESNAIHAEHRADVEAHKRAVEQTHAATCDLIGGLLKASETSYAKVWRLREALDVQSNRADAEASRASVLERALVRLQSEARLLRESLDDAEARLDDVARENRKARRRPKMDENERALYAFARGLYK